MSKEDDRERFWNFVVYKMWMTDAERDEAMPVMAVIIIICIVVLILLGGGKG